MSKNKDLAIKMLHDRVLLSAESEGERRTGGGILIPATVSLGRKLSWAKVVATGPNVRSVKINDRVLYDPESRAEVEFQSKSYILIRERDLHAVAQDGSDSDATGLYL